MSERQWKWRFVRSLITPSYTEKQYYSFVDIVICAVHSDGNKLSSIAMVIAGNFRGRKLLRISQFCGYSRKFSLWNLGAWRRLARHKRAIRESFLRENRIFRQIAKVVSLESFPAIRYLYCIVLGKHPWPGTIQYITQSSVHALCTGSDSDIIIMEE